MAEIKVRLEDGEEVTLPEGSRAEDLARLVSDRLSSWPVIAVIDGEERDLSTPLPDGATVRIVTADEERGLYTIRHSTAHVLAQAVLDLYPGATFGIGPPIEDGFYYDFELPEGRTFTPEDLEAIEQRMREIVEERQPFIREEIPQEEALELFRRHPYKQEIIEGAAEDPMASPQGGKVRTYRNPPRFVDVCRGPHVPHTGLLKHFKLLKTAGAYWRGDENNPMLQRIYGTAWDTESHLKEYLERVEEAERRDHRRLATELDLISFSEELGAGLALWHPKGAMVRLKMEDFSRRRHLEAGYQFVYTPHLARSDLWKMSGHLDFYAESMFPPMETESGSYHVKPMNCPFHMLIYRSQTRSWRELPLRLFELGTVYRWERSGVLHGLMRIRGFTQDDSHIFCAREQVVGEIRSLLGFVLDVLRAFGFEDFEANLSTRPEGKSVGDDRDWEEATAALRDALESESLAYEVDEGGGAFYGPKIDVHVRDAIGRRWQLSTIQVDFQLPQRFDLHYDGPDGKRHRPIVVHRALFGSIERFFGVLLEHYAGAFPLWLAPVQVAVLPVRDTHLDYAEDVASRLREVGLRVEVARADEPLGARIRKWKMEKVPYVLVVGDSDVEAGSVGVNPRGGEVRRGVPLDEFVSQVQLELEEASGG